LTNSLFSLGLELEGGVFRGLLQNILRLASASTGLQDLEWFRLNPNAYPSIWLSALAHDDVLNAKKLAGALFHFRVLLTISNWYFSPHD